MTVQQVPLGEVLHRVARTVEVDASSTYANVGLLNRARGVFEKPELRGAETKYKTLYRLATGDLVYSKLFGWEGAVALVPDWADGACVSGEFPTYSLSSRIDSEYLHHVIAWEGFSSQIAASTTGMGQRRQRVNPGQFERIAIPLPDLSEQQRIAGRLNRIAETSRTSGDLEEFELSWRHLVERLTFGSPTSPQRIGDVLRPKSMEVVDRDSDYQIAGVYSFGRGLLSRGTLKGADTKYKSFSRLARNDVVYSKLGAFEGAVAVVPASYDGFHVSPEFPVFEICKGVCPEFVRYSVIAQSFARQLNAASSGVGARQKRVSPKAFLDISVPIPSLDEQREIARVLDLASQALQLKRDAVRIRKALLPAARNDAFAKLT
jgi:type I restriction enzyme S subunit